MAVIASLLFVVPILGLTFLNADFKEIMIDPNSISGKFKEMELGTQSLLILLIIALFKTSFAEEILFRGFIAKRLISILGFQRGNFLQAAIFGALHVALLATITHNIAFLVLIFIAPMIGAYVSVYLNEKMGDGSIIPGWISHGLANVISYSVVGFLI
jgi:membrane protease YdiL (CAAX protease family)